MKIRIVKTASNAKAVQVISYQNNNRVIGYVPNLCCLIFFAGMYALFDCKA